MVEKEFARLDHSKFPTLWAKLKDESGQERCDNSRGQARHNNLTPRITNDLIPDIIMSYLENAKRATQTQFVVAFLQM
jgi:hypothetical protein